LRVIHWERQLLAGIAAAQPLRNLFLGALFQQSNAIIFGINIACLTLRTAEQPRPRKDSSFRRYGSRQNLAANAWAALQPSEGFPFRWQKDMSLYFNRAFL
jgi:hypothetical protein